MQTPSTSTNPHQSSAASIVCLKMLKEVAATPGLNETARKELFISYLRQIFPSSEHQRRISLVAAGAEQHVATAPSQLSSSAWGFIDTLNGQLVMEFKADLTSQPAFSKAQVEIKRYVASLWTKRGTLSAFCAVATDVLHWRVWRPVPNTTPTDGSYTAEMVSLDEVESLDASQPSEEVAHHLALLLKRILIDENLVTLTGENLQRDLGLNSTQYAMFALDIRQIILEASQTPEVELAVALWQDYQAYNARRTRAFNVELYTNQLYLVLLARLIVAAALHDEAGVEINDDSIEEILSGSFFANRYRIANFVERDFFGWITRRPWLQRLTPIARQLYHTVRTYDFAAVRKENIFRLIYDEMLPPRQSAVLGQRSTPEKLAKAIVRELISEAPTSKRFLDPACGSGTFLSAALVEMRALLRLRNLSAQSELAELAHSVTGIDIDPVAVILSKAVWTLTLSDLIPASAGRVFVPVYHADSLFVATDQLLVAHRHETDAEPNIEFDQVRIPVPLELFNDTVAFDAFVEWCQNKAASIASERSNVPRQVQAQDLLANIQNIFRNTGTSVKFEPEQIAAAGASLVNELALRIHQKRNGIWAFVLRNSYRPTLLSGRFDIVATNPPWLAMSSISNIPYKKQLEAKADYLSIKPQGSAFPHTEIATTFALYSVQNYLAPGGVAAFVLPGSIYDGDNHDPFRRRQFASIVPYKFSRIWDLRNIEGLFKLPSFVLFGVKQQNGEGEETATIPTYFWRTTTDESTSEPHGELALAYLGKKTAWIEKGEQMPVVAGQRYYAQQFRQGADLMPRTTLFVEVVRETPTQEVVTVQTSTIELANRDNKVLKGQRFRGQVNRRYLFSTVTSSVLLPFIILERLPTIVLPIELQNGTVKLLSTDELVDRGDIETASWFSKVDEKLGSKSIRERINERGKLLGQRHFSKSLLIHVGASGAYPCAAIQRVDPKGDRPLVADQTTYVAALENEDEAYYLIGVLNAPVLGELIHAFQAKGDFGARHIHKLAVQAVPQYDPASPLHRRIGKLARAAEIEARSAIDEPMEDQTRRIADRRSRMRTVLHAQLAELDRAVRELFGKTEEDTTVAVDEE